MHYDLRRSLVTCPVALYKATEPKGGITVHLVNPRTRRRIVQVVKDPATGQELDRKTLVRGFEISKDQYVLIDPGELKALRIESTRVLDLERFLERTKGKTVANARPARKTRAAKKRAA